MQVLYVEDSKTLREGVAIALRKASYVVTTAADGTEGLEIAQTNDFAVIILDVMLPGISGLEILRRLRAEKNPAAVLILTSRQAVEDRIDGLDLGCDDYMVKPFDIRELLARVRALVRRGFETRSARIEVGKLRVDPSTRRAYYGDREVLLRPREFDVLELFALRAGKLVTRFDLLNHLYDHATDLKSNAIDSAICTLRKRLTEAGANDVITTVSRRGYLLEADGRDHADHT